MRKFCNQCGTAYDYPDTPGSSETLCPQCADIKRSTSAIASNYTTAQSVTTNYRETENNSGSLILAIVGIVCVVVGYFMAGIVFGSIAFIVGLITMKKTKIGLIPLILGIVEIVIMIIFFMIT